MEDLKKDQNELNDILIKREGAQGGKLKNVLLLTAALLLIVIIGVLTYRIIDSNAGDVEREVPPVAEPIEQEVAIEDTAPPADEAQAQRQRLDELIARHREAREQEEAQQQPPAAEPPAQKEADAAVPEQEPAAPPPPPPAEAKPEAAPKPEPKAEPKPEPRAEAKPSAPAAGSFFVQVESLTRDPQEAYLKELRDSGYDVVVRERSVDGRTIKRVYIGPYTTREAAAAVLPRIREELNPEAFIIRD